MDFLLASSVISGVAGGLAVLAVIFLMRRKSCPKCCVLLPRFRRPESLREAIKGGWTCGSCRTTVGRDGKSYLINSTEQPR